jgi:hypothetical protein
MSEPLYTARATVAKVAGTHRRLTLATGEQFDVGVHGPIRSHFRLDAERTLPLPVDYIVAATGG